MACVLEELQFRERMDTQVMTLQGGKRWNRYISQDFLVVNVRNPNSKGLKHKANKKKKGFYRLP